MENGQAIEQYSISGIVFGVASCALLPLSAALHNGRMTTALKRDRLGRSRTAAYWQFRRRH
jgi:hypothetical protein